MATEPFYGTFDALFDLRRSKRKCKELENKWDDDIRLMEGETVECNYQRFLQYIFGNAEMHENHKRKMENVIYINDDDDSNGDNVIYIDEETDCEGQKDPHYELFLSRLKEHKKAYVVESEMNGLPYFIKYEAEGSSEDEQEQENQEKMMTVAEELDGQSNQKPGLLNNQLAMVHHPSDMQAQSSNTSSTQRARLLMNLVKEEHMRGGESELLYQDSRTKINWLVVNACDHDNQAQLVEKDKVQSQLKSGEAVKGDHGTDIKALIQMDKRRLYREPGIRNNWGTQNLCEHPDSAQPGEKDKVQNRRKSKKVVQIDNEHSRRRLGPGNNRLVKNKSEHARQARSADNNNVWNLTKKFTVVEGMNLVKEENEPEKVDVIQIDNAHLHQKHSPRSNWVKGNQYEHADQPQDDDKDEVQKQIYVQQLVKGKNVTGEDDGVNEKALVLVDNEHLTLEPNQKNNWLTQYQNQHIDQARPVMKQKGKIYRKIKVKHEGKINRKIKVKREGKMDRKINGKRAVKADNEANQKTVVLYQGPRLRNYYDVEPSRNDTVHGQRKSMEVVQADHGLSNKKTGFGNYAVKIGSVEAANCLLTYKNGDESNLEKEGNDEIVPEVEILDSAAYIKQGILTPFVPSKRFDKSMVDDGSPDLGGPNASDAFRKEVFKVLRRPYDKEEYNQHREAIRNGFYLITIQILEKASKDTDINGENA